MAREAAATPTADPNQALDRVLDGSALTPMHWKIWWLSANVLFHVETSGRSQEELDPGER